MITFIILLFFFTWLVFYFLFDKNESLFTSIYTIVFLALFITFLLPAIINPNLENGVNILLQLYFFFTFFSILYSVYCFNFRENRIYARPKKLKYLYLITLFFYFLNLYIGLYDITLVFDRAINPRDYTYIREGVGIITFISISFNFLSVYFSICEYLVQRNSKSLLILIIFLFLYVIGGGKANMVSVVIIFMFARQQILGKLNFFAGLKFYLFSVFALILSFGYYARVGSRTSNPGEMFARFVEYQQEFLISNDLFYQAQKDSGIFFFHGLFGTLTIPIPRLFFPSKQAGALYSAYVNPILNISSDPAHFATYGIQLEGVLVFGYFWPFISALIMFIYFLIPKLILRRKPNLNLYNLWMALSVFGLVRAGLLYTTPYMILLLIPLMYIILKFSK